MGSVPHDVLKAKAQRGDLEAQKKLGALYREGSDNIKIDLTEAIKWLRMAAEQGDVQSHNTLGAMYARRNAGHEDTNQAFHW